MRCAMCGHESPPGSSFCLNCGAQLQPRPAPPAAAPPQQMGGGYPGQTPGGGPGLPQMAVCPACRAENPAGMKFCRNCGTVLGALGGPAPGPAPGGQPMQPSPGMLAGPPGGYGAPGGYGGGSPNPGGPGGPQGLGGFGGAPSAQPGGPAPGGYGGGPAQGAPGQGFGGMPPSAAGAPTTPCPRCGAPTPVGFAFCQQCGFKIGGSSPGGGQPSSGVVSGSLGSAGSGPQPQEAFAGTIAAAGPGTADLLRNMPGRPGGAPGSGGIPGGPPPNNFGNPPPGNFGGMGPLNAPASMIGGGGGASGQLGGASSGQLGGPPPGMSGGLGGPPPGMSGLGGPPPGMSGLGSPSSSPLPAGPPPVVSGSVGAAAGTDWGTLVSVNRDGTDGDRFALGAEYVVVGRAGADIPFDQDRFLARQHARFERSADGVRVVPVDTLNGVFRRIDTPAELVHGSTLLVGREVLRYESVEAEERAPEPLVRHGVAMFGSPPREPWGRLLQLLPSGGVRDIRHLWDDEVTIGREEGDIVFSDDAFLSRRHASVGWDGRRVLLTDLQSSNGTFLRIDGPTPLRSGEYVRMGDQLFRIELRR
jgi:pSer/pThr/pTyr-binding forkhead associated (FHA) protein